MVTKPKLRIDAPVACASRSITTMRSRSRLAASACARPMMPAPTIARSNCCCGAVMRADLFHVTEISAAMAAGRCLRIKQRLSARCSDVAPGACACRACQPHAHRCGRHRLAVAEALHGVNAGGAQEQCLLGGFHPFRGDLHAETAPEADDGVHNGGGVRGGFDARGEALIDLELVERKAAQI